MPAIFGGQVVLLADRLTIFAGANAIGSQAFKVHRALLRGGFEFAVTADEHQWEKPVSHGCIVFGLGESVSRWLLG